MLYDHIDALESFGLNFCFAALFLLIGLAIKDVLKQGSIPPAGQKIVWLVLSLGCIGFIAKGVIELIWKGNGLG